MSSPSQSAWILSRSCPADALEDLLRNLLTPSNTAWVLVEPKAPLDRIILCRWADFSESFRNAKRFRLFHAAAEISGTG